MNSLENQSISLFLKISQLYYDLKINFFSFQEHVKDAGRIGLTIICAGMLGSVMCGIVLDKTHKFK